MNQLYAGYADNCLHSFHRAADYMCNVDYASYARYSNASHASYAGYAGYASHARYASHASYAGYACYASHASYAGYASYASYVEYLVDNSSTEKNYADYFHLVAELAKLVACFDVLFQLLQR